MITKMIGMTRTAKASSVKDFRVHHRSSCSVGDVSKSHRRLVNTSHAIVLQEVSGSETDWLSTNRLASKLATLKQSRQSHYADFAGFPSRKSFQVGRKYHNTFSLYSTVSYRRPYTLFYSPSSSVSSGAFAVLR